MASFSQSERDRMAVTLNAAKLRYLPAARSAGDTPLARTKQTPGDEWYRVATGKGILVLHELHEAIGDEKFCDLMDAFGRANAGKEVTAAMFADHVAKATGKKWDDFFAYWLTKPGLPDMKLERPPWSRTRSPEAATAAGPATASGWSASCARTVDRPQGRGHPGDGEG